MPLSPGVTGLVKLDQQVGTGASGVLTFSSVPGMYNELEVVLIGRSDTAATSTSFRVTINGNTTASNYFQQTLQAAATVASASENMGGVAFIFGGMVPGATSTANVYGSSAVRFPEYANTSVFKPVQIESGGQANDASGLFTVSKTSGVIKLTAAITSIELTLAAGNWTALSVARLYGMR